MTRSPYSTNSTEPVLGAPKFKNSEGYYGTGKQADAFHGGVYLPTWHMEDVTKGV